MASDEMKHIMKPNYNALHCRQRKTQSRPQVGLTCKLTENFVKFGHAVFEICERTDRQTYRNDDCNTSYPSRQVSAAIRKLNVKRFRDNTSFYSTLSFPASHQRTLRITDWTALLAVRGCGLFQHVVCSLTQSNPSLAWHKVQAYITLSPLSMTLKSEKGQRTLI